MDLNFEKAKKQYESVEIPKELDEMVNKTIEKINNQKNKNRKTKKWLQIGVAAALIFSSTFVVGVNSSKAFAESVANIPIVGELAHLVSFRDYKVQNNLITADVKIPSVEGISDSKLKKQINDEIYIKMNDSLEEAKIRAKEYKEAYLATGGTEENYRPITVNVDYELKTVNEKMLSFTVFHYESLASAYAETFYYNIDLNNNKLLTLEDMFGNNFKDIVDDSVKVQIEERKKETPNAYFEGEMGFKGIEENQNFYINEDGKVVVVFDKYEIASGAMGKQEFIIEKE